MAEPPASNALSSHEKPPFRETLAARFCETVLAAVRERLGADPTPEQREMAMQATGHLETAYQHLADLVAADDTDAAVSHFIGHQQAVDQQRNVLIRLFGLESK